MTQTRAERARFLFREDYGIINERIWRFHVGWLVALAAIMTAILLALQPFTHHDLATSPLIVPMTILAFAYIIGYAFGIILIAICYVMLSIKRLRDRRLPTVLAGLVPLLALLAGAAHFLQPQVPDVISLWYVVLIDTLLVIAVVATTVELGFRPTA